MTELIAEILPFAVGVFASPLPVILSILMLFTPRPRITATIYVLTWIAGLTALTVLLSLLAGVFEDREQPQWLPWVRVALGAVILAMAVAQWRRRGQADGSRWLSLVIDAEPRDAVRFGLLMSAVNPKEVLMAIPAGLAVGSSGVPALQAGVAIAVFVLIGAASVAGPLVFFLVLGHRSLDRLTAARDWLQEHSAVVSAVVLGALGVWLVAGGLLA